MIHETMVTTRFCETDAMGHINNVNFFVYLEVARVDFLLDVGVCRSVDTWDFVLATIKCDFKKQMHARQSIKVTTQVLKIGTKSVTLKQLITNTDGEILGISESVIVRFDKKSQATQPLTEEIITKLNSYLDLDGTHP